MRKISATPAKQGLYDPANEKDSCGVGFVVDIQGRPSHKIVQQALTVLLNLRHRGACAATFGEHAIGLMSTDEELVQRIRKAGETVGERCWQLPLWDEYYDLIRATYADIQNISKKNAGTITAGMFLKEFADHTKSWTHLDIAGTAWTDKGATGVGVRLFVELIKSYL